MTNPPLPQPSETRRSWTINLTVRDGETVPQAVQREAKELERRLSVAIYGPLPSELASRQMQPTDPLCPKCGHPASAHYGRAGHGFCMEFDCRCTVTELYIYRHALTEMQTRERQALDAHAHSFSALAAVSLLTDLGGEVDDYGDVAKSVEKIVDERDALRAENAKLREAVRVAADKHVTLGLDDDGIVTVQEGVYLWQHGAFEPAEALVRWSAGKFDAESLPDSRGSET